MLFRKKERNVVEDGFVAVGSKVWISVYKLYEYVDFMSESQRAATGHAVYGGGKWEGAYLDATVWLRYAAQIQSHYTPTACSFKLQVGSDGMSGSWSAIFPADADAVIGMTVKSSDDKCVVLTTMSNRTLKLSKDEFLAAVCEDKRYNTAYC